jgi:uncharacterized membrane protein
VFYDLIAFGISFILIQSYYFYLIRRTHRAPQSSVHALNARTRERWVKMIMSGEKLDILAIQTVRNSVMAANFMATTAILLLVGVLNLGEKIGPWAEKLHPFCTVCNPASELWMLKLGMLLGSFALAFYYFAMAIRFFNHVGYLVNLPCDFSHDDEPYRQTCAYLNKAGRYYTFGTRTFFFSLPLIAWFFGACTLVLATLGLLLGLIALDSVPSAT